MKKLLIFILTILSAISALSLTACNDTPKTPEGHEHTWVEINGTNTFVCSDCGSFDGAAVTEEQWAYTLTDTFFQNITVKYFSTITLDSFQDQIKTTINTIKIVNSSANFHSQYFDKEQQLLYDEKYDFTINGQGEFDDPLTLMVNDIKILAITTLEQYENFTYDEELCVYCNDKEFTAKINEQGNDTYSIATMKDTKVKFGENGNLEYISTTMTQTVYMQGVQFAVVTGDIIFTFYDIGTTVIETP